MTDSPSLPRMRTFQVAVRGSGHCDVHYVIATDTVRFMYVCSQGRMKDVKNMFKVSAKHEQLLFCK